ncbi:pentatricopeptide repeat-containing protein At2g37230-like [Pistacia vera]|uniref:pentatricopeptide repeat-containing protein At2g37230-like n=1 Tax=Pistacia vera TaxID=55513 RepID=UPI001262B349|nr:pentatricopeptide repeat-containing protein At2g37230-like [Pistacia vera]
MESHQIRVDLAICDLVFEALEALLMRGHVEEALGCIDLLMHSGCAPNFGSLLSILSEKGKTVVALKLLYFCVERDCIVDFSSCEKMLDALLAIEKTLNAYSLLFEILAKGRATDWKSCEDLITSLNQEGNIKQEIDGIRKGMVKMESHQIHVDLAICDLVAEVLEALLMRGHVEEALGCIDLLMHNGCGSNFGSLLSILFEKGKTVVALKLLYFCGERDCIVDFSNCEKMLDALLATEKTLNAYSLLFEILAKGGATDWKSYEDLITSLNQEGNTKQADILSRMIREGRQPVGARRGRNN